MKLLIYSHFFAPGVGGVETIVLSLARGLAGVRKQGGAPEFDITLVTQTPADNLDDRGLSYSVVRRPTLVHLWRLIRESDVVHLAGPALVPLFLARLAGKPTVVEHHTYQAICQNGILLHRPDGSMCPGHFQARQYSKCLSCQASEIGWFKALTNLLLMFPRHFLTSQAAHNVAVSKHVLERHSLPHSTVIYHGIEDPLRGAVQSFPEGGIARISFGYLGRLVSEKGIPVLLQAASRLIKEGYAFELRMIGDGPERADLEAIIRRESLQSCAYITGYLTGEALAEALRGIHVFVVPSVWEETAGLAAIEQMMRGRLVIASDVGGLGEMVSDAGWRCRPGDAEALADCMRRVLQDTSLVQSVCGKTRDHALRVFSVQRMVAEHANVYREVRKRRPDA